MQKEKELTFKSNVILVTVFSCRGYKIYENVNVWHYQTENSGVLSWVAWCSISRFLTKYSQ